METPTSIEWINYCANLVVLANQLKRNTSVMAFVKMFGTEGHSGQEAILSNLYALCLVDDGRFDNLSRVKWLGVYR